VLESYQEAGEYGEKGEVEKSIRLFRILAWGSRNEGEGAVRRKLLLKRCFGKKKTAQAYVKKKDVEGGFSAE